MIVTCMTSDCRGATSLAKPKSRFGGRKAARAGAASEGDAILKRLSKPKAACHDHASPRPPPATSGHSASAYRRGFGGAFCRAARRGGVAELFPVAFGSLPLQPLPRRDERIAAH